MFTALRLRAALVVFVKPLAAAVLLAACATSPADQPSSSHTVLFLAPNDTVAADEFDGADLLIVRSADGLTSAVTDETQAVLVTAASLSLVDPAFLQATHDRGIILGGIETGMLAIQPFSTAAYEQPRPDHIQGFGDMYQMAVAYSITCPGDSYYSGFGMQPAADLAGLVTGMQERLLDRCDRP